MQLSSCCPRLLLPSAEPHVTDLVNPGEAARLLVAPLDAALALRQRDDAALAIAKDLHLDVPRALHVLLHKHARIPKAGFALPGRDTTKPVAIVTNTKVSWLLCDTSGY